MSPTEHGNQSRATFLVRLLNSNTLGLRDVLEQPMLSTLGRIVSLRTASATIVTIVFYVTILIVAEWQDVPRTPPANPKGVDLGQAFQDLKFVSNNCFLVHRYFALVFFKIATGPHPYNSHRNDVVRDYILDRVGQVAKKFDNVNVVDDLVSNASFVDFIFPRLA